MSHTVENKSYEEDLRIEVTEGKFFRTNITRGSRATEECGELALSKNKTCFVVVPNCDGGKSGDYFVFAGAYLPSKEVDECRKELCEEMTISDFECFQIDCKRQ
ncbi:uncharacterized protein LOC142559586 isoform X2 [Dermacentor variabilis]|uniref:uncharacterized protein LOC142559586 isoform X2 n=1 Tax=Dermacentor variabilis TaxID=34621 RepID=UPI003F5BBDBE